jgi:hypothetical protein
MDEVNLILKNSTPFCNLSKSFPDITFLRWCNSSVDYLEFYGNSENLDSIRKDLPGVVRNLNSSIIHSNNAEGRFSALIKCRCTVKNSTIRIAESDNCLWVGPVEYSGGSENLSVVAVEQSNIEALYRDLESIGSIRVVKKQKVEPESMRDLYTISSKRLFGELTEKQVQYILAAIGSGYFDIPRNTDLRALSSRLSISKSTLQEHLSKANSHILKALEPMLFLYLKTMGHEGKSAN